MSVFNKFEKKAAEESENAVLRRQNLREVIKSLEKNEIIMEQAEDKKVSAPDDCKLGGKPYLPANFEWPTFESEEDGIERPLSFFCQINLAQVKPYDKDNVLPERGMLYFFYECETSMWGFDPSEADAARAFYFENTDGFVLLDLPDELAEEYVIPEIAVEFKSKKSYPNFEEFDCYSDLDCDYDDYFEILEEFGVDVDRDPEDHKLLGYADIIQSEMLTECESIARICDGDTISYGDVSGEVRADVKKGAGNWTLLLQLSTITKGDYEWMFGDGGMLYFYIKKDDLAAKRFDKMHFSVQCY